jgi:hypothetical protein
MSSYHITHGGSGGGGGGDGCADFWEGNREVPPIPLNVPITTTPVPIVFKAERFNGTSLTFNPNVNQGQLEFNEIGTYRVSLSVQVIIGSPTETLQVFCLLQPGGPGPTPPNYISMVWDGHTTGQQTLIQSATRMIDVPSLPFTLIPRILYSDPNPPDTAPNYSSCWFLVEKICDEAKVKSFISYGGGS